MNDEIIPGREPVGPISPWRRLRELRAPMEAAAYVGMLPILRVLHLAGEQHPVLVLPGGMVGDTSSALLRLGLRAQGYSAHGWGLGRNLGADEETLAGMRARVDELYHAHNSTISIIGHSLGGIYARMLARDRPDKIRQVITLGSPFRMVETDQFMPLSRDRLKKIMKEYAAELDLLRVHEHDRAPITVPTTSIYSRTDGFAPWQLTLDEVGPHAPNPRAENVEVRSSHLGLVGSHAAFAVILDRLGLRDGHWAPFKPILGLRHFYPPPASWIPPDGPGQSATPSTSGSQRLRQTLA